MARFQWTLVPAFLFGVAGVQATETWQDPVSGIVFVQVGGGCFSMGADAPGAKVDGLPFTAPAVDEVPAHEVCLGEYWIGRTEVTRGQWYRVLGEGSAKDFDRPIASVGWHDAQRFVATLSRRLARRVRLPSEAEWEFACHAGLPAPVIQPLGEERVRMLDTLGAVAWYRHPWRDDPRAEDVGRKAPNAWGLFDMLGNVWEWSADSYAVDAYRRGRRVDSRIDVSEAKVIRGGSYMSEPPHVRCGARNSLEASDRTPVVGFRVVMEPESAEER